MTRARMSYILRYVSIEELRRRWLRHMTHVDVRREDPSIANTRESQDKFPSLDQMRQDILERVYGGAKDGKQTNP